ncbi:MAG: hypothetical protein AVDCRST_MAG02-4169 [uncultured Rubrobacteraceae bacterium]|uniref:Uncharacterized protein n=1 Tax=uncultured Rubrobacteraceae bacterium TaxID=349277 RepID=A0A6J4RLP7_9ACTN|nr:MAG: hypothetical protein AVDCRST_MAG02-4169 [uncultured Rubrobacteraceae bacterium]
MARGADPPRDEPRRDGPVRRALRVAILGVTFLFVVAALAISCALVVYTAYGHDLQNGFFALLLAVLSAQIAINWFLWKDEEE